MKEDKDRPRCGCGQYLDVCCPPLTKGALNTYPSGYPEIEYDPACFDGMCLQCGDDINARIPHHCVGSGQKLKDLHGYIYALEQRIKALEEK